MIRSTLIVLLTLVLFGEHALCQKIVTQTANFSTNSPQNMWGPGNALGINENFEIFPEFRPGPYTFDTSPFTKFNIEGLEFGASLSGLVDFGVGPFTFEISGFTAGEIEVDYPAEITLEMPDDDSFNAGETIVIRSAFNAGVGAELSTRYPEAGIVKLDLDYLFDAQFGVDICFIDCTPRISIIPPPGVNAPSPLVDQELIFFQLTTDSIVYICDNTMDPIAFAQNPFQCIEDISAPWTIPPPPLGDNLPFSIEATLPHVTTTSAIGPGGQVLLANGDSVYVTANLDIIQTLGFLPPPVGPIIGNLNGSREFKVIPDFSGELKGVTIEWELIGLDLVLPITHNQDFDFTPRTFTTLTFPDTVEYVVHSSRQGDIPGKGVNIMYEVGDSVSLNFPCEYAFMDVTARHSFQGRLTNDTYDQIGLFLDMRLFTITVTIDRFVIFPEICIPIPFVGDVCTPELAIDPPTIPTIGPLFEDRFPLVPNINFPSYFKDGWVVTDFNTVDIPTPFRIQPRQKSIDLVATDVVCFGDSTGTIETTFNNPPGELRYEWSFGGAMEDPVGLPAGVHYVKITDNNGCEYFESIEISQPDELKATITATAIDCEGTLESNIEVLAVGGTGTLSYSWNSSALDSPVLTNQPAGFYSVIISDASGCRITREINIEEPNSLDIAIFNPIEPTCFGEEDGALELYVAGGTPPYQYSWSSGDVDQRPENLSSGDYSVTVTDANGCQRFETIFLDQPTELIGSIIKVADVDCFSGDSGALQATVSGGTPPYAYSWINEDITLGVQTATISNLQSGEYRVEVLDALGCRITINESITEPRNPLSAEIIPSHLTCVEGSNGSLDLTVLGGTEPYTFVWSNGATTEDISNLAEGSYEVNITDANGCTIGTKMVIITPQPIKISFTKENVSCADQADGSISITKIEGGFGPYTIRWSTGAIDEEINELSEGEYSVTVIDAAECSITRFIQIDKFDRECLFIPSAFSPNGDGVNDTWVIRNSQLYPQMTVRVFNRWGLDVLSTADYNIPWNGVFNGRELEPGTYYYIVDLKDGSAPRRGTLTIVQ